MAVRGPAFDGAGRAGGGLPREGRRVMAPRPSAGSRTTPVPERPMALERLRNADPVMARLIDRFGDPDGVLARRGPRPGDAYGALVRSIVGQQLSAAAARTI